MNILFDISVLGFSNIYKKAKTGVFRVAHQLALGLLRDPSLAVKFCAPVSYLHYTETINFLKDQTAIDPGQFCASHYPGHDLLKNGFDAFQRAIARHEQQFGANSLSAKVMRTMRMLGNEGLTLTQHLYPDFLLPRKYLHEADIYHSPFHGFPSPAKRLAKKAKYFLTVHDLIPIKFPHYFKDSNTKALQQTLASLGADDWAICDSYSTRNDLLEYHQGLDPAKVAVAHLAASALFFPCQDREAKERLRHKYKIPAGIPYFLSVSTLEPRKNIPQVIRSFVRLVEQERVRDLVLVLAGPTGWDYQAIFDTTGLAERYQEKIIFTGFVDDDDLAPLYSDALAFVYPSFYEGFGLPPLEAMQCGTPVITSNVSSLPEVVGPAGIMVSPTDGEALCAAMHSILTDQELLRRLSQQALEQAAQFSWERCVRTTVDCYRKALSS